MRSIILLISFFFQTLLAVPSLTTTAKISSDSEISILFKDSIVDKNLLNSLQPNSLLNIQPHWQGKIRWVSQNRAIFIPMEAPLLDTKYSFSISPNVYNLNKELVQAVKIGTKKTFKFSQNRWKQIENIQETIRPRTYLSFSDDINPNTLASYFYYKSKEGKTIAAEVTRAKFGDVNSTYYTPRSWTTRWNNKIQKSLGKEIKTNKIEPNLLLKNAVIVRPVETLPVGTDWKLIQIQGLPNNKKNAKITSEDCFLIGTKKDFKTTSIKACTIANQPRFIRIKFNAKIKKPENPNDLSQLIQISPSVAKLSHKIEKDYIDVHANFTKSDHYTVSLKTSIEAVHGLRLSTYTKQKVSFKHIEASVAIPSFSTAQLSKGQRKYPIETVNVKSVRVRIKALNLKQAVRAHQGYDEFLKTQYRSSNGAKVKRTPLPFSLISGSVIYDDTITVKNSIDTSETLILNWDDILPQKNDNLIFFLDIQATPKDEVQSYSGGTHFVQTFIQLTDIGLAWKTSKTESLIYCYSCDTGKPIANVTLKLFSEDALVTNQILSDKNGIARIPNDQKSTHLAAICGTDCYILSMQQDMETVGLWRFPVQYDWYKFEGWKKEVLIFTDRKLYKPGEVTHIKGIVRERKDNIHRIAQQREATLFVYDADGRIMVEKEITLSEHGSFHHSLKLPPKNVGTHRIKIQFPFKEMDQIDAQDEQTWERNWMLLRNSTFNSYFSVQEFRKNAFKVETKLNVDPDKPDQLSAHINANYYMGTVVSNGKLDWYLSSSETGFYPSKFHNFYFGNHLDYDPAYWDFYYGYSDGENYDSKSERKENGSTELNSNGKFTFQHSIQKSQFPTPRRIKLTAEVTDGREQTISSRSSLLIHPCSHYIGIARIDSLLRVGQANQLNFIVVDQNGNESELPLEAELLIKHVNFETVKVRSRSGEVTIQNKKKETVFLKSHLTLLPKRMNPFTFHPDRAGKYIIEIKSKDPDGRPIATATRCKVYGTQEFPWAVNTGMKIELAPEKKYYQPGETARILVKTPIEGTALVTLERSGVNLHFRTELTPSNPVIEVPLKHLDAPNVYVSVMLIRGASDSPLKFKEPALKLGYCNLNVENQIDKLDVIIDSREESYRPNHSVTLTGTILDYQGQPVSNAEVTLYAEDNGVLDVIGYKMPKPLKFFNKKISLSVESGTSLHKFLQEMASEDMHMMNQSVQNKGYTIGGGGDLEQVKNKIRKNFDPCALWQPNLKTDQNGRFKTTFKTPDALTSYRVMAVASAGGEQFGSAVSELIVNKPIMLEPLAPRFANEGDIKRTKLYVANNSKYNGTWKVTLKTGSHTECIAGEQTREASQTIDLYAGKALYLNFDTRFIQTGNAQWHWSAEPIKLFNTKLSPALSKTLSDQLHSSFEVHYPRPILKGSQFQKLELASQSIQDKINPNLFRGRGHIELELCNNLLFRAQGAAEHLLTYPYG